MGHVFYCALMAPNEFSQKVCNINLNHCLSSFSCIVCFNSLLIAKLFSSQLIMRIGNTYLVEFRGIGFSISMCVRAEFLFSYFLCWLARGPRNKMMVSGEFLAGESDSTSPLKTEGYVGFI